MRNVLILGSGRSGTSMTAGSLAKAGYFMGENLYPPRECNPKGFFEDSEVNAINENLIAQVVPNRPRLPRWIRHKLFRRRPLYLQRWLARVPVGTIIPVPNSIQNRIQRLTDKSPYCFKDPRFSYTLSAWRPFLSNTVFICVFRDPGSTVLSIMKECQNAKYLRSFSLNPEQAIQVWTLMYRHILEIHMSTGKWLFIHYNQMLTEKGLDRVEQFVECRVDRNFPDTSLSRPAKTIDATSQAMKVYHKLCLLADYQY